MSSIRDVAKEAGVSIGAASRILSHDESFKTTKETKQKVFDAVERLDYKFSPRKRTVARINIGCILPLTSEKYSDPFFTSILHSLEETCTEYNGIISITRNCVELTDASLLNEFCNAGLQGLFIMEDLPENILYALKKSIPYIIAVDQPSSEFNSVGFDHLAANTQVMEHFFNNGYQRIAYIGGASPYSSVLDSLRLIAYREALRRRNIAYDESIIKDCEWDLNLCAEYTEELLCSPNRPDAIFAGSDTLASVILGVIYRSGLRCPNDIGVVGFNNLDTSAHTVPPLTTVDVPTKAIGRFAAHRLFQLIKEQHTDIAKISLPTTLIVRGSTKPQSTT